MHNNSLKSSDSTKAVFAALGLLAAASLGACSSEGDPATGETTRESRASQTSRDILRVSGFLSAPPVAAGANFDGLDEVEDALGGLEDGLADIDCANYELNVDGSADIVFDECVLDGDLGIDGSMVFDYDIETDCADLGTDFDDLDGDVGCNVDASVSVSADFDLDGVSIVGSWNVSVNQDGDGSLSGSFSASDEDFSMDFDIRSTFGASGCRIEIDYTDSDGTIADLDIDC